MSRRGGGLGGVGWELASRFNSQVLLPVCLLPVPPRSERNPFAYS